MQINHTMFIPEEAFLENTVCYKYREVNQRSLYSLILNQVYLSCPEKFNDPFEIIKVFAETKFSEKVLPRNIKEAGMLCLCQSAENLAMWSYYGDGLKGFAIGFDLKHLLETLEPTEINEDYVPRWKLVYQMNYQKELPDTIDEQALISGDLNAKRHEWRKMFATKSYTFEHEEECRIVIEPSPDIEEPYTWPGHGLYQYHPDAVNRIVLGELLSEQDEIMIRTLMAGRAVEFWRAQRSPSAFRIELVKASHLSA